VRGGQVAEFAVSVDDGAFVGGDGVGSVVEGGADVLDGGLSSLDVEGCGFEKNVGAGGGEPGVDGVGFRVSWGGRSCPPTVGNRIRIKIEDRGGIKAVLVGDPAQTSRGDAGDAIVDAVAGL
jgi:hypothetical protein